MNSKKRVFVSWSSGKDSAWATYQLQQDPSVELIGLLCTVNRDAQRAAMHAVRVQLLQAQAKRLNLPLIIAEIPQKCSNEIYEQVMREATEKMKAAGATHVSFGDLYLEDIRQYRLDKLQNTGLEALFPLWQRDTRALAQEMIDQGLRTIITCIDPKKLDPSMVGRYYDEQFIADLPEGVDPCGENGEFHSCVVDGPMFSASIPVAVGEIVERDGFWFADVTMTEVE